MTKYGYARISTTSQSRKEQIHQLLENDVEKEHLFLENL
jgi:DNA invertase Pin-like site-specific DNA recombinase